jgi:hypothetical protein
MMSVIRMFQQLQDYRQSKRNLQFTEHLQRNVRHHDSGGIAVRTITVRTARSPTIP